MRVHWWQRIRWRMALASVSIVLLATILLAATALVTIRYYYVAEQQSRLGPLAQDKAQSIGDAYALFQVNSPASPSSSYPKLAARNRQSNVLRRAVINIMSTNVLVETADKQYLYLVLDSSGRLIYPLTPEQSRSSSAIMVIHPHYTPSDQRKLSIAIQSALHGQIESGEFGQRIPVNNAQPFTVAPIFSSAQSNGQDKPVGAVVVTTFATAIPSFVSTVAIAVGIATLIIVVLAALAAIIFSQTITRPLTTLTHASRVLASGDYTTPVSTNAPGEIGELSLTFNDMAARLKRDMEELRQQEKWRRELIMNITHDLATPLTAIAGLGEALVDGINQSHEDYEATGRIIVRETLRLRRLVQDLHVMARLEAGALQPKKKLVRLATLVDQTLATMITEFERYRVEPNNDIPYNLPIIEADPDMLTRVFSNLWSNALRHTPADGMITISASHREKMLVVSITDTGEGIPEEALTRIFERFYRADSARQSATGGSGLGLAIVQAIIEAHGGKVWAENMFTGGARVSFTLPLQSNSSLAVPVTPLV